MQQSAAASAGLLLRLHVIEERVECFEAGLPVLAELLGPAHRIFERRRLQATEVLPTGDAATHQIGSLEHAHVLAGGRERHPQRRGELAQVALPAGELPDDRAAGGVGQGVEDAVEPGERSKTMWFRIPSGMATSSGRLSIDKITLGKYGSEHVPQ